LIKKNFLNFKVPVFQIANVRTEPTMMELVSFAYLAIKPAQYVKKIDVSNVMQIE
jgi:hypothetical protein